VWVLIGCIERNSLTVFGQSLVCYIYFLSTISTFKGFAFINKVALRTITWFPILYLQRDSLTGWTSDLIV
jgi:hypothetical protein